jgi:hypothetical protein
MVSKKVVYVFVVGLFLVLSIYIVSAKHAGWHFWGPDVQEAPFDATVSIANSPPTIVSWTEPDFDTSNGGIDAWPPTSCGTTTVVGEGGAPDSDQLGFVVTVTDPNTDSDLDGAAAVTLTVQDLAVSPTVTHVGSCVRIAGSVGGADGVDFRCSFTMDFHDSDTVNWIAEVTATDDPGLAATNDLVQSDGGANYPFFDYGSLFDVDVTDSNDPTVPLDTLEWTGIVVTSTDKNADTNLVVQNCGNGAIDGTNPFNAGANYVTVRGRDLTNSPSTDFMEPDTFMVDQNSDPCTAGQRLDDSASGVDDSGVTPISVLDVAIATGASVTDNIYFCIQAINQVPTRGSSPITSDSYSSSNPPASGWEVNACEAACPYDDVGDDV